MGQRWKWSISEVFLQIIVGRVGPLPHGKYGAHNPSAIFLEASMYGEAQRPENCSIDADEIFYGREALLVPNRNMQKNF